MEALVNTVKNRVINTSWGTLDVLITVYAQLVVYHDLHASTAGRATAFTVKLLLFSTFKPLLPDSRWELRRERCSYILYSPAANRTS